MLTAHSALGHLARRSPRGRGRLANLLSRSTAVVGFTDTNGHRRQADLSDQMERRWFTGALSLLPDAALESIERGAWVMDVGANIGAITGQLANRVGPTGAVWALEPLARNVEVLEALVSANDLQQVSVVPVAAGESRASLPLRTKTGRSGWASFSASWIDDGEVLVPVVPIDELISERGETRRLSFLKIDVEGHELAVIQGAAAVIKRDLPVIYMEFNNAVLTDAGSSTGDLLDLVMALGYEPAPGQDEVIQLVHRADAGAMDLLLVPGSLG